jgi:hypothetical protein
MNTTKKRKQKSEPELCCIGKKFSRRLSASSTWWTVSHSQELRDGNGKFTSLYNPL